MKDLRRRYPHTTCLALAIATGLFVWITGDAWHPHPTPAACGWFIAVGIVLGAGWIARWTE